MSIRCWGALLLAAAMAAGAAAAQEAPPIAEPPATDGVLPGSLPPDAGDAAEDDAEPRRGSSLSLALDAAALRDDGATVASATADAPADAAERDGYFIHATLLLDAEPGPRTDFLLAYQPEFESFPASAQLAELEAIDQAGGVQIDHALSRQSRFFAGGWWREGDDAGRRLGGILLLAPYRAYEDARAALGWERRWRDTGLTLQLEGTRLLIDPGEGLLPEGVEENDAALTVNIDRALSTATILNGNLAWVEPLDQVPGAESARLLTALVGMRRKLGLRGELMLSGGWVDSAAQSTWLVAAEIGGRGEHGALALRYDRSLADLAGFLDSGAALDGALRGSLEQSLTLDWRLGRADGVHWEQLLWLARTDLVDADAVDSFAAAARLVAPVARRFAFFVEGQYREQKGAGIEGPESRLRYAAGISLGLGGAPDARRAGYDPDRLTRVLPGSRGGI